MKKFIAPLTTLRAFFGSLHPFGACNSTMPSDTGKLSLNGAFDVGESFPLKA